jgi:hypothetical protein
VLSSATRAVSWPTCTTTSRCWRITTPHSVSG